MMPMMFLMPIVPERAVCTLPVCTMTVSHEAWRVWMSHSAHLPWAAVPGTRGPNSHCWRVSIIAASPSKVLTWAVVAESVESPAVVVVPVLPHAVIMAASTIYNNVIFISNNKRCGMS